VSRVSDRDQGSGSLDTLAQLDIARENQRFIHNDKSEYVDPPQYNCYVADPQQVTSLYKRARAKYITWELLKSLIRSNEQNSPIPMQANKPYWNSFHCSKNITLNTVTGEIKSRYCKNRWCLVCARIKTAKLIKHHSSHIREFSDPHFVTLTVPNVSASELRSMIGEMQSKFSRINKRLKSYCDVIGIRKTECTHNLIRNDYHPHFHVIAENELYGNALIETWLQEFPNADYQGQDIRPIKDIDNAIIELFKYFTKLITTHKGERYVPAYALNEIFKAMKRKRDIQNYGYKHSPGEQITDEETDKMMSVMDTMLFTWDCDKTDWISIDTGDQLTGYKPSERLKSLFNGE